MMVVPFPVPRSLFPEAKARDTRGTDLPMASTKLTITGMTCDHCVAKVEQALKNLDGVWSVFVDLDGGEAEVDYDDAKTQAEALTQAVRAAGYEATVG